MHSPQPSSTPRSRAQRLSMPYRDLAGRVASLSHDTTCLMPLLAYNTILGLQYTSTAPAIQPSPPSLQYNPVYCNTMTNITTHFQPLALQSQSQYNACIVIQFPLSQYNLGSSPIHICTKFFIFFIFHYFFLSLFIFFFNYFQQLQNYKKNYLLFFFIFLNTQINLQKFIFFIFFSFSRIHK